MRAGQSLLTVALGLVCTFAWAAPPYHSHASYGASPTILPPHPPAGQGYWSASGYHGFVPTQQSSGSYNYSGYRLPYRTGRHLPVALPFFPVYFSDDGSAYVEPPPAPEAPAPADAAPEQDFAYTPPPAGPRFDSFNYGAAAARPDPAEAPAQPMVVVLKSGQRLLVQSYAVMDGMLWDLTRAVTQKIPVTNIDVAASSKASEANGVEFPSLANE